MAKTIYCVRKDPLGPKTEDNWIQMDAKEFKEFRKTKEARNRYFIRMGDDCHEGCDTIIIEVDKEQYDEWRREYDRHRYLARQERNSCVYSIEQVESEDQIIDTVLGGKVENPEKSQITNDMRIRFRKLFDQLTELEKELLATMLYDCPRSMEEISEMYGIRCEALRQKKSRLASRIRWELGR